MLALQKLFVCAISDAGKRMLVECCDVRLHVNKKNVFTAVKNNADGLTIFYLFLLVAASSFATGFLNIQKNSAKSVMSSAIMKINRVRNSLFISTEKLYLFSIFKRDLSVTIYYFLNFDTLTRT